MCSSPQASPNCPAFERTRAGWLAAAATAGGFVFLLLMMLSMGMRRGPNHDEMYHLAAATIFGRRFSLPYVDFPFFHMPNQMIVDGIIFRWCARVLLAGRLFAVAMGWLTVLLLWWIVRRQCREQPAAVRWLLPACAALLLLSNPIFRDAYWRALNHTLSGLCGLAAFGLAMGPGWRGRRWVRWLWAGVFIGLAIGTRITYAPLAAPLMAAAALEPPAGELRERIRGIASFCAGAALSLIPSLILFAMAPAQFFFANFTFNAKANVLYRESYHDPRITLRAKLLFPFTTLLRDRANLLLALLFVILVAAALTRILKLSPEARYRLLLVLGLIPFTLIGAVAPSPSQHEYYYALVPLMVLGAVLSASAFCSGKGAWICPLLLVAATLFPMRWSWHEYQRLPILGRPSEWPPVQMHEAGAEVAKLVATGRVLTLEPLYPLEAGLDIYPPLATCGIAWRTEPFLTPADRVLYKMIGPDNFAAAMDKSPPAAVLTIPTSAFDPTLIAWARAHGYVPHLLQPRGKMIDQATVWTAP